MAFVQVIEFHTQDPDSVQEINAQWEQATAGKRTARRQIVTRDRNEPDRYLAMVFFDSYESAMENSRLPETEAFAAQYGAVVDGQPHFHDLDVLSDEQL